MQLSEQLCTNIDCLPGLLQQKPACYELVYAVITL